MAHFHALRRDNLDNHHALAVLAGWKPSHRALEAERAELKIIAERDNEARMTAARRNAQ